MTEEEANRLFPPLLNHGFDEHYRAGRWKARRLKQPNETYWENSNAGRSYALGYRHGLEEVSTLLTKLLREKEIANADSTECASVPERSSACGNVHADAEER